MQEFPWFFVGLGLFERWGSRSKRPDLGHALMWPVELCIPLLY